ncbi:MAG: iron-sulfur cluster assembly accessory protein [Cyanosarcina radialis HA8281-LM2]|jgi:iron-sulfur cluster assembly accessory protein|nr:iron-sulfur cluster assembly accessory protein [Cyanosarcina radialis HA8281-LM2]
MIQIKPAAVKEIGRLRSKEQKLDARFRLGVQPGGCSGFFYTLGFDTEIGPSDRIYDCNGITVVVDDRSANYVSDLTLDYSEDLMGGGFRFHNPLAVASCGCGNSFSVNS